LTFIFVDNVRQVFREALLEKEPQIEKTKRAGARTS
jgi:hypothetical protein